MDCFTGQSLLHDGKNVEWWQPAQLDLAPTDCAGTPLLL